MSTPLSLPRSMITLSILLLLVAGVLPAGGVEASPVAHRIDGICALDDPTAVTKALLARGIAIEAAECDASVLEAGLSDVNEATDGSSEGELEQSALYVEYMTEARIEGCLIASPGDVDCLPTGAELLAGSSCVYTYYLYYRYHTQELIEYDERGEAHARSDCGDVVHTYAYVQIYHRGALGATQTAGDDSCTEWNCLAVGQARQSVYIGSVEFYGPGSEIEWHYRAVFRNGRGASFRRCGLVEVVIPFNAQSQGWFKC